MHALFFPPPSPPMETNNSTSDTKSVSKLSGAQESHFGLFSSLNSLSLSFCTTVAVKQEPEKCRGGGSFFFFLHAQNWCKVCIYGCVRVCTCVIFFFCARNVFNYRKLIKKKYYCMARKLFSIFRVIFGVKIGWDRHVFPYWAQAAIP